MYLVTGFEPKM